MLAYKIYIKKTCDVIVIEENGLGMQNSSSG